MKFYECDEECDICTYTKCYDKFLVDLKAQKFAITVSVLIFVGIFSFVILILLAFIRALKSNHNRNRNNPNFENDERLVIN